MSEFLFPKKAPKPKVIDAKDLKKNKPKAVKKNRTPRSKFTDSECQIMALMYDSNKSKWQNKSNTWKLLLKRFYEKNEQYIEKGRKLNGEELK